MGSSAIIAFGVMLLWAVLSPKLIDLCEDYEELLSEIGDERLSAIKEVD
jgi:hypothetical protein